MGPRELTSRGPGPRPASFWLGCLPLYFGAVLLAAALAAAVVYASPVPPPRRPSPSQRGQGEIRLGGFQIPFYREGRLASLLTGRSALLLPHGAAEMVSPTFVFFSGDPATGRRLSLSASSGRFDRAAGVALLEDGVRVSALSRRGNDWLPSWVIKGEKLRVSASSGRFSMPGPVELSSRYFHLRGKDLTGAFDPDSARLLSFSFGRIYESTFTPDLRK